MKFLFIVQGEGRGHFTQAIALSKMIKRNGHVIVGILVGRSRVRQIPSFFTKQMNTEIFGFDSPNFLPSASNKKPFLTKSIFLNLCWIPRFFNSIRFINKKIKELKPDKVINFYDLLTGLTYAFFRPKIPLICVGHQYTFLHPDYCSHSNICSSLRVLKFYTRITSLCAKKILALSFYPKEKTGKILVVPPLLREEVLNLKPVSGDYILGYILNSGFSEEIEEYNKNYPDIPMHFFWDKKGVKETENISPTLQFHIINDEKFLVYMSECKAYATTAGFESVCEAMYLSKPILMVPAHLEQKCNADDAMYIGAGIVCKRFDIKKLLNFIPLYKPNLNFKSWVDSAENIFIKELTGVWDKKN